MQTPEDEAVREAVKKVRYAAQEFAGTNGGNPFRKAIASGKISARELGAEFAAALAERLE